MRKFTPAPVSSETPLPNGVKESMLKYPKYNPKAKSPVKSLELWYAEGMGWVLPTLDIGGGRGHSARRTYAIALDGHTCRVGAGPHIKRQLTIYVRESAITGDLKRLFDLLEEGKGKAGQVRDRISSRRAEGQLHRQAGHHSWLWGSI